jgi:16S rRNA (adenine(1408)-N(1))-methyltransferase
MAVDIGTGDGKLVLRDARAEPGRLHVGIDSNADGLREAARRAARRPERGGAPNALFVRAAAEALPEELAGLATSLTVILPWGSLLRAVAAPDPALLASLRALAAPAASLVVVMGYDARSDPATAAALAPLTRERLEGEVLPRYRDAGFAAQVAPATLADLRRLGTTWSSRLAFGRERAFWQITARAR